MAEFLRNHWAYLIGAVLVHAVFAAVFGLTMITMMRQPQPATLAIQAVVVDRSVLDRAARQQQRDRTQEREQERQRQQVEERKQQERREAEQRAAQERQQEQKQREEEQRRLVEEQQLRERQETERKAQAEVERQRKAEAERQRVAEIERKQKEEAQRRKAAEDARAQQQREAELRSQLEEEEGRRQAEASGLLSEYVALIEQRVVRNWNRPPSARAGLDCRVRVTQTPGGTVLSVQIDQCNGDAAVKQSIEAAVMRSSPLPPPPDPRLFERNLVLVFRPEE